MSGVGIGVAVREVRLLDVRVDGRSGSRSWPFSLFLNLREQSIVESLVGFVKGGRLGTGGETRDAGSVSGELGSVRRLGSERVLVRRGVSLLGGDGRRTGVLHAKESAIERLLLSWRSRVTAVEIHSGVALGVGGVTVERWRVLEDLSGLVRRLHLSLIMIQDH